MKSVAFTVTTTAQAILTTEPVNRVALIHVLGAGTVYLGGSDVTSSNGLMTEKNAVPLSVTIPAGEVIYALTATGTEQLRIMVQGD